MARFAAAALCHIALLAPAESGSIAMLGPGGATSSMPGPPSSMNVAELSTPPTKSNNFLAQGSKHRLPPALGPRSLGETDQVNCTEGGIGLQTLQQCLSSFSGDAEAQRQCCQEQIKTWAKGLPWWSWILIVLGAITLVGCLTCCVIKLGCEALKAIICCPCRCLCSRK
eukprot:TRINITY_DN107406_c0_g1_i1.p1 TRINITY_DN107406_c0_g1~~TRINITY_DN107406_c0_g1_i1.p1  ORF type:complete len:169 (+),score=21.70 TRINITY_DN107406_c0_g1_i1:87-593(+)